MSASEGSHCSANLSTHTQSKEVHEEDMASASLEESVDMPTCSAPTECSRDLKCHYLQFGGTSREHDSNLFKGYYLAFSEIFKH